MFENMVRHSWNVLSGVVVLACSLWLSGPGIAETDTPDYRWYFMLWFLLWTIGFLLQFKQRTKSMGLVLTFIPTFYYLLHVLRAMELF